MKLLDDGSIDMGGQPIVNAVDDPEKRQVLSATINGSATWQKVTYPTAFPAGSQLTIIANAQDDNGFHFFIRMRAITLTSFQFIAVNDNGSIHTGAGVVGFAVEKRN